MELLRAEESRALTTQFQLAEEAQKQARGMEMDYEEVIHLLEAEIAELKSQGVEPSLLTNKVGFLFSEEFYCHFMTLNETYLAF